jgi:predicted enzyme related to lactoylglutathione lyase
MAQATAPATQLNNRAAWIDLSTSDAAAARDFYSRLFGWQMEVSDDPQYGGYATAKVGDRSVAGIGPKQDPNQPTVWSLYIGTDDIDALASKVSQAGGTVVAPPFDVGDQGRMAVFQDPSGAFISAWQGGQMSTFLYDAPGSLGRAELNARGVANVLPFYEKVFGWTTRTSEFAPNQPPYNEFQLDGESILGALETSPELPAGVPNYWEIDFAVDDVDATHAKALELGATEIVPPQDFPGGRFSILVDPQGGSFAILKTEPEADRPTA